MAHEAGAICFVDAVHYALEPMARLGLEDRGGAVRISPVHYNTSEEIAALGRALADITQQPS
jgi:selenocysteine lyase/cysteine desulfurase